MGFPLYTGEGDYSSVAEQDALAGLIAEIESSQYIESCFGWFPSLRSGYNDLFGTATIPPATFYPALKALLDSAPAFVPDVKYLSNETSSTATGLYGTKITCMTIEADWDSDGYIATMDAYRAAVETSATAYRVEVHTSYFAFWDGLKVMKSEMLTSMGIAVGLVFVICLALLGDILVSFLVCLMVVLTDISVLGCYHWSDMSLEFLTSI